jgi:uncharacterized protein (DUF779 family)
MKITATDRAAEVVKKVGTIRDGDLTITIGTGCCESTAPFLYENHWPGPDQEVVGEVAGVKVYASQFLRDLYPGDDGHVIEVIDELAESLSAETEFGVRLVLRGQDQIDAACERAQPATESDRDAVDSGDNVRSARA